MSACGTKLTSADMFRDVLFSGADQTQSCGNALLRAAITVNRLYFFTKEDARIEHEPA
jgi:hypothetical protein